MALVLENTYSLTDLLKQAGLCFTNKQLRVINFVFNPDLKYQVEYTDGKSNRLRYSHYVEGVRNVLAYYELDKVDQTMNDFFKDIRTCIHQLTIGRTSGTDTLIVELFLSGQKTSINYNTHRGGFVYTKMTS